jgi:HSP20 family molecular chaperone IbpA
MFPVLVPTTRLTTREALDEMIEKLDLIFGEVRAKAFEAYLRRGEGPGSHLEDWFAAERELFRFPESEIKETESCFEIRAAVPGFRAEDLQVQVLPELIVIEGKAEEARPSPVADPAVAVNAEDKTAPLTDAAPADSPMMPKDEKLIFTEFGSKRLFRQYRLPMAVDVNEVRATLDKGILTVSARKKEPVKAIAVPIHTEVVKAPPTALAVTAK